MLEKILDEYKELKVAEKFYPSFHKLKMQTENACGIASSKNAWMLSFGEDIPLRELLYKAEHISDNVYKEKVEISKEGIGPTVIAGLARYMGELSGKKVKVFMTKKGNIKQLRYLLGKSIAPIIHRGLYEDNGGPHYEVVTGISDKHIYFYNSFRRIRTSGLHRKGIEEFEDRLWNFKGERWFLSFYPSDITLQRSMFQGRNM